MRESQAAARARINEVQAEILRVEAMLRRLVKLGDALAHERTADNVAAWRIASVDAQELLGVEKPRRSG